MTVKSTHTELGGLFDGMVKQFVTIVEEGETEVTKDGEVVKVTPKAATLNVIRQFLKDQGINAVPDRHPGIKALANKLPFDLPEMDETGALIIK